LPPSIFLKTPAPPPFTVPLRPAGLS